VVSGEAFMPAVRAFLVARGVEGYQAYGTADLGLVAYETEAREGLVLNEDTILEIVRPGTGDPLPDGEVGEVVVTTFNADYPLVRFATGDLSAVLAGRSPCGRTNVRIKGWLGRADQTTKVRGLFVHPHQVAEVLRRHGLARGRLIVGNEAGEDRMTLRIESAGTQDAALAGAIESTLRDLVKLRGAVQFVSPGSLPNDGKVIEDARAYS
jgi:phenylacetate-CoA ligase